MTPLEELPYKPSPEVADAFERGGPVVALESTIITHGMPYPRNLETARLVEDTVRDRGATPATIAVLDGELRIGLDDATLSDLARSQDVMKLSRADLAFAVGEGRSGATTVAATMIAARLAGIAVFATGGIGGVHRGAERSFDISADLRELASSEVIVVCAGAKAILDIEKTLEVLETYGVPVIGYGTDDFPAFWSRSSGLTVPLRHDSADAIARHHLERRKLRMSGGMLIANPVPEKHEIPRKEAEDLIGKAIGEADAQGISSKNVTPFLLQRMFEISQGRTLETNIALVVNNAALAAEIAAALAGSTNDVVIAGRPV